MSPTRRSFVNRLLGTSFGALAAALLAPVITFLRPSSARTASSGTLVAPDGEVFDPASVADGAAGLALVDGEKVVVIHQGSAYEVLTATCTHLGCLVRYDRPSGELHCPCHGGRYDTAGRVLGGPPSQPLRVIPVRLLDGTLRKEGP